MIAIVVALVAILSIWGVQRLIALRYALTTRTRQTARGTGQWAPGTGQEPCVTVQIPLYNEPDVGPRAAHAALALDWPKDKLEIQILDDSDDSTPALIPPGVVHVRRGSREGYKAGALAHGLARANGEYIAIFDADFIPPRNFLRDAIARMNDVDVLQFRWGHENRRASWFTRAQATLLDAHFSVEQKGRAAASRFFPFNGTAGVWRRDAIERAGGWSSSTLTEDLDLSVRAWKAGCRFAYVDDVDVPGELPADIDAWRIQQHRWAKGGAQTFRRHAWDLLTGGHVDALLRVGQTLAFLPLLALIVLLPFAAHIPWISLGWVPFVVSLVASSLIRRRANPLEWLAAIALGVATAPTAALGVVEGLFGWGSQVFARTPKASSAGRFGRAWLPIVELVLGAMHLVVAIHALSIAHAICAAGLLYVGSGASRVARVLRLSA